MGESRNDAVKILQGENSKEQTKKGNYVREPCGAECCRRGLNQGPMPSTSEKLSFGLKVLDSKMEVLT